MAIIDFHSHILPGIDDGSDSAEKSLYMQALCAGQGIDTIVATPHFYAWQDRVEEFLERRGNAYQSMLAACSDTSHMQSAGHLNPIHDPSVIRMPQLRLGAEVTYFRGISEAEKISQLTVEGTELFLLELPFEVWDAVVLQEVEELIEVRGFQVMLAHLERYLMIPENKKQIRRLLELPLHVQLNAGSLLDWKRKGKTLKLFKNSKSHVLGSDMHGVHRRPPNLAAGREVLQKKFGTAFIEELDRTGEKLLQ